MADQPDILQAFQPLGPVPEPPPPPSTPIGAPQPPIPTRGSAGPFNHNWTLSANGNPTRETGAPPSADDLASQKAFQVPLSNGTFFNIPADAVQTHKITPEIANQKKQDIENYLDSEYKKLAAQQGGTYETPGRVYSASQDYPNNPLWRAVAGYLDPLAASGSFPGVGNWLNVNVAHPVDVGTIPGTGGATWQGAVGAPLLRTLPYLLPRGVGAALGTADIGTSGINAIRRGVGASPQGDLPVPSSTLQAAIGDQLPADASTSQRVAEAVMSGINPAGIIRSLPGAVARGFASVKGGDVGGDIAASFLGPNWREAGRVAGSIAGGAAPGPARTVAERGVAPFMRGANAPENYQSGQALAQDERARAIAAGQQPPDVDTLAHTRSLLAPTWQRVSNWLSALPITGHPLTADAARTEQALEAARNATTSALSGGTFVPGTGSREAIGTLATGAAREAYPRLLQEREQGYTNLAQQYGVTPDTEVSTVPFLNYIRQQQRGNLLPGDVEDALNYAAQRGVTEGTQYGARFNPAERPGAETLDQGPVIPTAPYGRLQRVLSGASIALPPGQMTVNQAVPSFLKSGVLNSMRDYYLQNHGQAAADAFDTARATFRNYTQNILPQFERIAGTPGGPGEFGNAPPYATTADELLFGRTGRQSSNVYGPFAERINPAYQRAIAANAIDLMGRPTGQFSAGFRPEKLASDIRSYGANLPTMLSSENPPPPNVLTSMQRLQHAERLGSQFDVPQSAGGLTRQIGAGAALHGALTYLAHLAGGPAGALAVGSVPYFAANALTAPSFKRALAGAPVGADLTRGLYEGIRPSAASIVQRNYPIGGQF